MDKFEELSKVYIQIDSLGRIIRCEGGYTMNNIDDISKWIYIDEGEGDKYNLCQAHYFSGGLYTEDGICRWKYNGECLLRSNEEIEEDRASILPSPDEDRDAMMVDHEFRITMLELGI